MPWIIGIDEAGYGPNLGPLVMTAVAIRLPARLAQADLWHVLCGAVRRNGDEADDRLLVADSKLVYTPARGLFALEMGVLTTLADLLPARDLTLADCLGHICSASRADIQREIWYTGSSQLPLVARREDIGSAAQRFRNHCKEQRVALALVQSVIVSTG